MTTAQQAQDRLITRRRYLQAIAVLGGADVFTAREAVAELGLAHPGFDMDSERDTFAGWEQRAGRSAAVGGVGMTTTGAPAELDPYDPMTVLVKTLQEVRRDLTSGAATADWEQLARLILQRLRDAREPGWYIEIGLCDAPEAEAQAFIDAIADVAMVYEPRAGWDPFMAAHFVAASDSPPGAVGLGLVPPEGPNPAETGA